MFTGEVIFGGVGSGLYGMFFYVVIAVFVAGLMVGRTPEYLGKKIEAREIKIAAVGALFVPTMVLVLTAISRRRPTSGSPRSSTRARTASREALYAYDSQGEQQRQRVRRLRRDELLGQLRHGRAAPRPLRAADRRARARRARSRRRRPCPRRPARSAPTAPTFVVLLVAVIVLTAGLMIFPALTLGPIVEALML